MTSEDRKVLYHSEDLSHDGNVLIGQTPVRMGGYDADGKPDGVWYNFDEKNGQLRSLNTYQNGELIGSQIMYGDDEKPTHVGMADQQGVHYTTADPSVDYGDYPAQAKAELEKRMFEQPAEPPGAEMQEQASQAIQDRLSNTPDGIVHFPKDVAEITGVWEEMRQMVSSFIQQSRQELKDLLKGNKDMTPSKAWEQFKQEIKDAWNDLKEGLKDKPHVFNPYAKTDEKENTSEPNKESNPMEQKNEKTSDKAHRRMSKNEFVEMVLKDMEEMRQRRQALEKYGQQFRKDWEKQAKEMLHGTEQTNQVDVPDVLKSANEDLQFTQNPAVDLTISVNGMTSAASSQETLKDHLKQNETEVVKTPDFIEARAQFGLSGARKIMEAKEAPSTPQPPLSAFRSNGRD